MLRDLKEGLRSLLSQPGFTSVVVITLALAIGINTTIFSALYAVLLRPLDYEEPERLVMLWESNPEANLPQEPVSAATYLDWRERSQTFESIAAYRYKGYTLLQEGEPQRVASIEASPLLFDVLQAGALLGQAFAPEHETPGSERLIILSHASWSRRFGADPEIVGTSLQLDGEAHTVLGVMPAGFVFPPGDTEVEMWSPLTLSLEALPSRPHRFYTAIGRLTESASLEQARLEMDLIGASIARENPESNQGWGVTLVPAHEQLVGDMRLTLWFLFGAVFLVLLIGCVNIANLLLVRGSETARDFAVRASLGADRWLLIRRSLLESLLLALLGGLLGLLVASWGISVLRSVIPAEVPRIDEIRLDPFVLGFTLLITLAAGLLFGLLPAVRAARLNLVAILQEGSRSARIGRCSRLASSAMVIAQVALAFVLVAGAILMSRSFQRLLAVDPGFRTENVTTVAVSLPRTRYGSQGSQREFFMALLERLQSQPGFADVGAVSRLPMSPVGVEFELPFTVEGLAVASPSERPRAEYRAVIPDYFEAMGIAVSEGRLLEQQDSFRDRRMALINKTLQSRYFPDRNPVGLQLEQMPMLGNLLIVGVAADVQHGGLEAEVQPEVFVPFAQFPLNEMHIVVHSTLPANQVAAAVRREVLALDSQLPLTAIATMEELLAGSIAQPRFNMVLLLGLALCAAAIAAVGIYGVVSYSVVRRTGELGLRMALGADRSDTVSLILREVLTVVGIGALLGMAGALGLAQFISSLLFGLSPADPTTYVLVVLGIIAVALLASAVPVIRATRLDPALTLKGS